MKLLITGLNGFVAGSIVAQARKNWVVAGMDLAETPGMPQDVASHQLDLLDEQKLTDCFMQIKPDAVIHTAAIANIDVCENNPEMAWKVNVGITRTLATLCAQTGAKMILCSTDSIFDGTKGYYTEIDAPTPLNHYARTKVEAEKIVLGASDRNVVARLSLVMGLAVMGKGNSFLADMIEKLKKGDVVKFPSNEIRTPVDVVTLGAALTELAGNSFSGIIHLAGNTLINRYEMAIQIARILRLNEALIEATDSNAMPGRAPRPNDASLVNKLAAEVLTTPLRSLEEGVRLTMNFTI
ncbi:MAG: NAD(P)-dependent oxidoreductase [Marinilabiliales bacterium]|nr:NAD(P)-dependent oxidoreductase [Marinilabiliales bacterium]